MGFSEEGTQGKPKSSEETATRPRRQRGHEGSRAEFMDTHRGVV